MIAKQARHHAQNAYVAFCCKPANPNHVRWFALFSFSQLNDPNYWFEPSRNGAESWAGWVLGGLFIALPVYLIGFVIALLFSIGGWFLTGFALAHEWFSIKYDDLLPNRIQWADEYRWNILKVILFRGNMHSPYDQLPGSSAQEKLSLLSGLCSGFFMILLGLPGFLVGMIWGFLLTTIQGLFYGFRLGWVACFSHIGHPECVNDQHHGWSGPFLGKLGFLPMLIVGLAMAMVAANLVSIAFEWKHSRNLLIDAKSPRLNDALKIPQRFQWMTKQAQNKWGYVRWVYAFPGVLVGGILGFIWSSVVIGSAMVKDAMAYAFCSVRLDSNEQFHKINLRPFDPLSNAMRPYQERYGDWVQAWYVGLGLPVVAVTFVAATLYNLVEAAFLGAGAMHAILYSVRRAEAGAPSWRTYTALDHRRNLDEGRDESGPRRANIFFGFKAVVGCLPFALFALGRLFVYLIGSTITGVAEISLAALRAGLGVSRDRFKLTWRFFSMNLPRIYQNDERYDYNALSHLRFWLRMPGMVLGGIVGLMVFTVPMALRLTKSLVWYMLAGVWAFFATFVLNASVSSLGDQAQSQCFDWTGHYDSKADHRQTQNEWWFQKLRQFRLHLFGRKSMAEQAADAIASKQEFNVPGQHRHRALLEELHRPNPIRRWMTPDYQWDVQLRDVNAVLTVRHPTGTPDCQWDVQLRDVSAVLTVRHPTGQRSWLLDKLFRGDGMFPPPPSTPYGRIK